MSYATHCDRSGCDSWSLKPEDCGFINVHMIGGNYEDHRDFCSWDCVLLYGATKPPLEVVPND